MEQTKYGMGPTMYVQWEIGILGVKWVMVIENECWIFAWMLDKNDAGEVNSVSGQIFSCLLKKW